MHSDEELKDGRYFPSPKEQTILTQTISQYFALPERSEQRSIIVQNVTQKLVEINPRWNHRAVRLWFNNNKRTCLKTSVQFDPLQFQASDLTADRMPPKKRPPRSSSAGSFITRPISPPADITVADKLGSVFTVLSQQKQTLEEKRDIEINLTTILADMSTHIWSDHIAPIDPEHSITALETMPTSPEPKIRGSISESNILRRFVSLETGTLFHGTPALVDFASDQQTRNVIFGDNQFQTNMPFPASSILFDELTSTIFAASGTSIYAINSQNGESPLNSLIPGVQPMLRSSMCWAEGNLVLGTRHSIFMWERSNLEMIFSSSEIHQTPNCSGSFMVDLPSITSVAGFNSMIASSSHNHHAIHVHTHQGQKAATLLGHGAGVTCLYSSQSSGPQIISGSADLTARIWDFRDPPLPIFQLQRHYESLSMVYMTPDSFLAFTGGEDHIVRAWDLRARKPLQEMYVGMGVPISIDYNPANREIIILTKEKSATMANGYQVAQNDESGRCFEKCLNLCVKYTLR